MKTSTSELSIIFKHWIQLAKVQLLLVVLLFSMQFLNAQVIYIDIIPDTTISAIGGYYDLDLNGDATIDYRISRDGYSDYNAVNIMRLHDSCYISYYNLEGCYFAKAYLFSQLIGDSEQWLTENYGANIANWGGITYCMHGGAFLGQTDLYLGLKIIKNGITYFGWVRIDVATDATWFTLKDYAYDSNPIPAGEGITKIDNHILSNKITLFPNPTIGNISISVNKNEIIDIEVADIWGHILLKTRIAGSGFVNLSGYPKGIYIIKGVTSMTNYIQKIIKN